MLPHLTLMPLGVRQSLEKSNTRIGSVYFMEEGLASVVALEKNGDREIEVGLIGREGMTGAAVVLGDHRSPNKTYVQAAGRAYCIRVPELRKAMAASLALQALLFKFVQAFLIQATSTAVANGRATIEQRLARWILMAHDRIRGDSILLTHEFLAIALAVRRAGVTEAMNVLAGERLIKATRGQVTALNRAGLERRAKDFYGVPEAEYRRLIG